MKNKEIVEVFADGEMKVKNTWLKAYDSESGKEGWISVDSMLSDIIKYFEKEGEKDETRIKFRQ